MKYSADAPGMPKTSAPASARSQPERMLVTGGAGFVGYRLGCALAATGRQVVLFDVRPPSISGTNAGDGVLREGITFRQGDLRSSEDVLAAVQGCGTVFHVGAYGMSGRELLHSELTLAVNVQGTKNVIYACIAAHVPRLVYTSTYNVLFGGTAIHNGDESLPYFPPHLHTDAYSRSKALAEAAVLAADGTPFSHADSHNRTDSVNVQACVAGCGASDGSKSGQDVLRTCALRPAAIWGAGEQRHSARIVHNMEAGLLLFVFGAEDVLVDWLHVDNFVSAQLLAAKALQEEACVAGGQAYMISDGQPVNNFEHLRPLIEGLGYKFPALRLPACVMYKLAHAIELLHWALHWLIDFEPLLTRTEVLKCGVTHYFSINKAQHHLGYQPQPRSMEEMARWYTARGHGRAIQLKSGTQQHPATFKHSTLLIVAALCMLPTLMWWSGLLPYHTSRGYAS